MFQYQPRREETDDSCETFTTQDDGFHFDRTLDDGILFFKPRQGKNFVRLLHPRKTCIIGDDMHVHYGVGTGDAMYLCLKEHLKEACPVCDRIKSLSSYGIEIANEIAYRMRPTLRVAVWLIDRYNLNKGPQVWVAPDRPFARQVKLQNNRRAGKYKQCIGDAQQGYDIFFRKEGKYTKTRYKDVLIAHRPTPLHDDPDVAKAWMKYVDENPVSSAMQFYEYNRIAAVMDL